jgi:hypothetical protein
VTGHSLYPGRRPSTIRGHAENRKRKFRYYTAHSKSVKTRIPGQKANIRGVDHAIAALILVHGASC